MFRRYRQEVPKVPKVQLFKKALEIQYFPETNRVVIRERLTEGEEKTSFTGLMARTNKILLKIDKTGNKPPIQYMSFDELEGEQELYIKFHKPTPIYMYAEGTGRNIRLVISNRKD